MSRGYQTQYGGFSQSNNNQRYGSSNGFAQPRSPLYPIGPTLTQPQFKPIARGVSPSPYLNRQTMKPPSYEDWHLKKAETMLSHTQINYEQREKKLISRNEKEIDEQTRRREQIRVSYERQINALTQKLNKNVEKKQKLLTQISTLQVSHDQLHIKLMSLAPPQGKTDTFEPIDRKQQEMIIMKNKLVNNMRENQTQLNKLQEEEQKQWEQRISEKQKILFKLQQNLRQKRLQLHSQKQKSLQKPDILMMEEEIRMSHYNQFIYSYQQLQKQLKRIIQERERSAKEVTESIYLKKSQSTSINQKRIELQRQLTLTKLRVEELQRVSSEMEGANENLEKQLGRKEQMIQKYEVDIHNLREKKTEIEGEITHLITQARGDSIYGNPLQQLTSVMQKINEDIKFEQGKNNRLKNQYQRLYQLLVSASSKNIHQTFNETLIA